MATFAVKYVTTSKNLQTITADSMEYSGSAGGVVVAFYRQPGKHLVALVAMQDGMIVIRQDDET